MRLTFRRFQFPHPTLHPTAPSGDLSIVAQRLLKAAELVRGTVCTQLVLGLVKVFSDDKMIMNTFMLLTVCLRPVAISERTTM